MILLGLALGLALAQEPDVREDDWTPELPRLYLPVPGECPTEAALVLGRPVPDELVDERGLVRCEAIAVPTSRAAWLLAVETSHVELTARYRLRVGRLEAELATAEWQLSVALEPVPWWAQPEVARWVGRLEVGLTVALAAWAIHEVR